VTRQLVGLVTYLCVTPTNTPLLKTHI